MTSIREKGTVLLLKILFALTAFAANSVLCRIALKAPHIDASSFSGIRLLSGALCLLILSLFQKKNKKPEFNWLNALLLCVYVFTFSIAYVSLNTATGALLLFGAVQIVMAGWGFYRGEPLTLAKGVGIAAAIIGICLLLLPGAETPPLNTALLMMVSGIAWAIYSLRGKQVRHALNATTGNFLLALPLSLMIMLAIGKPVEIDATGMVLAIVSGAVTSGAAYIVWYSILPHLSSTTASTLQLCVPCLAAFGGVIFLSETITLHMFISTAVIILGILLVIQSDKKTRGKSGD